MSTEESVSVSAPAPGAPLLCRADPDSVAAVAPLLVEGLQLARAGVEWSALVPQGGPWRHGGEPVDRAITGGAAALAAGAPCPVLALARAGIALPVGLDPGEGADRLGEVARALGSAQTAAGLPLIAWGLRRHSAGWTTAGALLIAHGALGTLGTLGTAHGLAKRA